MTTTSCYEEIIVRNRSNRVRDLAFGVVLAVITAFAFASIGTAGGPATAHAAPAPITAHACTVTIATC